MNRKSQFFRYLRVAPLILLAPLIYYLWERGGADALQSELSRHSPVRAMPIGSPMPDFTAPAEQVWGKKEFQARRDLAGKPALIHFWATWCAPCLQELPELIEAAERYSPKGFVFVAVAASDTWENIDRFFKIHKKLEPLKDKMVLIVDPEAKIAEKFGSDQFPETYIVNKDLTLDNKFVGAQPWLGVEMAKFLEKLVSK